MLDHDRFALLEESIFEAAIVPECWPGALQLVSDAADGHGAVLFSVTDWATQWTASPRIWDLMQTFVGQGWAAQNTRMAAGFRRGLHLEHRFVTEADYYDPGELEADNLRNEFFLPNGYGWSAGTIAQLPYGDMLCYSVERKHAAGPVGSDELAVLNDLRPTLMRAAMVAARLGVERARSAVDTLEQLGFAAAAVTSQGRVVAANASFESGGPWTTRGQERIALEDRHADDALSAALEGITAARGVRSIPLRVSGEHIARRALHIVPIRRAANDIFAQAVAIVVVTSAVDKSGNPALLQVLFDLTAAEAVLAKRLGNGDSIELISAQTGRSTTTLRNQLKQVMLKTGTHRQTELVRLLTRLVPPGL